jgi:hypothetical protein
LKIFIRHLDRFCDILKYFRFVYFSAATAKKGASLNVYDAFGSSVEGRGASGGKLYNDADDVDFM